MKKFKSSKVEEYKSLRVKRCKSLEWLQGRGGCHDPSTACRKPRDTSVGMTTRPIEDGLRVGSQGVEEGAESVVGQMSGVAGRGRQAAESGGERIGGDGVEFVEFPSLNLFR